MHEQGVTIGIPVYNEERFVESAIRSAAPQCEVLLVSDNGSTDSTGDIAARTCKSYSNAVYVRQERNMGPGGNFKFLLDQARTPYFLWLGGHDMIPDGYTARLKEALDRNRDAALAFGGARHVSVEGVDTGFADYSYGAVLADELATVRLMALIRYLTDCSLFYGMFRTEVLRDSWPTGSFLGGDHVLLSMAVLAGKFIHVPDTYLIRRDMRAAEAPEAEFARVTGQPMQPGTLRYAKMQRSQYSLACIASGKGGIARLLYLVAARYHLARRFGPFAEWRTMHLMERIVYTLTGMYWKFRSRIGEMLR